MRVLIAEDEPLARRLLRAQLEKYGHEVVTATDGAEALAALCAPDAPRLAVLDWNMPSLDGVDVCRQLRARANGAYTYVLLLTSRNERTDLVTGLESGANDFISKPVDGEVLRARVRVGERLLAMEGEIRRYGAYLAAVLAAIDSGIVLCDNLGRIVFANPAVMRMAGAEDAEAAGGTRATLLARFAEGLTDPQAFVAGAAAAQLQAQRAQLANLELRLPARRFVSWSGQPVALPGGDGWLDVFRDVTSEVELTGALAAAANTDHMTRLLNRRGGEQAIAREVARARRDRTALCFAMFDIDHFKRFNDNFGHAAGDRVLAEVTARIAGSVRAYDLPIRWGGEEVLVALPGTGLDEAVTVAQRVRVAVSETIVAGLPPVTVSAGVAELGPGETDALAAIGRADERLYRAKAQGRNRVVA
jgi:two-component system, cell cycle response regulator